MFSCLFFMLLFPSFLRLCFRFHFWVASFFPQSFCLLAFCLHHHLALWFLFFIFVASCDYVLVFIKLRNQGLKVFVFSYICVVVSIKLSSRFSVRVDLQFISTAMCFRLHLHHIQLVFGCSSPSSSRSSENSLVCVWIMLFVLNNLCFIVCVFRFAFVVLFMFCRLLRILLFCILLMLC